MPGRPEEVDAVQETDEQRRIAERRECAADIGDEEDEEHDDVDVVKARGIGAQERADQDHGRAGGADHAGDQGAEGEDRAVDEWRAAQVSRHQDAAGHHVEREQHHDEAQIFRQHHMHEGRDGGGRAVQRGERRHGEGAPDENELAVVAVPDFREQQRPGRNGQQDADERQRPRPPQRLAVERGGGIGHVRSNEEDRGRQAAKQASAHRHRGPGYAGRDYQAMPCRTIATTDRQVTYSALNAPLPSCAPRGPRPRAARRARAPASALLPSPSSPPAASSRPRRPEPRTPARRAPAAASAR